jgi:hypothetical protein
MQCHRQGVFVKAPVQREEEKMISNCSFQSERRPPALKSAINNLKLFYFARA